ncbi:hypothetical protein OXPF_42100 [Oxobacter pfennigii]|uniref:Uncharacterized protein n=1 Tax=Oxobacter pfennigii TaxID=36849 RepID=A0A0P8W1R9_9CLOT|nr:hypothetical protein OXPF_42100 [Oxobacter pfennigii]
MSVIDLRPQSAFNYSTDSFYREKPKQSLLLGYEKIIYLFFNWPLWLCKCVLLKAKLILFKLPYDTCNMGKVTSKKNTKAHYTLYPLLEVFNVCGCMHTPPAVDLSRCVTFENSYRRSYTEIDVTQIVQDWSNDTLENNGFLLMGKDNSPYIFYASSQHRISEMRPMLRLTCKYAERFCTLQTVPCDVKISKPVQV